MSLFPMFVKLEGRSVLIVGGGEVAAQKINALLQAGAKIRVVSPKLSPTVASYLDRQLIEWRQKEFSADDLDAAFLVIAATSSQAVNHSVFEEAERRGLFCNSVDDIENCHFYYGSVVQRGDLQIAISTNGKSPALAQRLRQELEQQFGPEYELWLEWLGAARELLRASQPGAESNKAVLHQLASKPMYERFVREAKNSRSMQGVA